MFIVLLTGWSESGKDTVADILVKNHGFTKYAFADPLKDLCSSLYGFPREMANTHEGKRTPWTVGYKTKTIRELLLETAKTDRSRFGDDIYAKETLTNIRANEKSKIVISDLRYFTELSTIQKFAKQDVHRLEVWKVVREGQVESPVNDPSEYGLTTLKPDAILENDGKSIASLEQKVSEVLYRKKYELSNPQNEDDGCCLM
jgi:hypothetical protein